MLLHSLQSLKYKPLIIIDLLWISPLQFPHYIPLFEKEPTGRSRMLADRSSDGSTLDLYVRGQHLGIAKAEESQ